MLYDNVMAIVLKELLWNEGVILSYRLICALIDFHAPSSTAFFLPHQLLYALMTSYLFSRTFICSHAKSDVLSTSLTH